MTVAYLHLVTLNQGASTSVFSAVDKFIALIHQHAKSYHYTPLITSRGRHWVARPKATDAKDLNKDWDLLLLLQPPSDSPADSHHAQIPTSLSWMVAERYTLKVAIPSRLLRDWPATNEKIRAASSKGFELSRLEELKRDRRKRKTSSQNLEASDELLGFAASMMASGTGEGSGPVTMLNLLRFNEGEPGRESYKRYGQAFGTDVGAKRGGIAKIVGKVVGGEGAVGNGKEWDEVAIVHYPNIVAFCDMASGEDYQAANASWRLPSLKDTLLLCTTEVSEQLSMVASKM